MSMNVDSSRLKVLIDLCRIYSPSGREQEVARYLHDLLREYSSEVFLDDVGNVIAIKGRGPTLMLHAHMDTIPGRLDVKVLDDRIIGLGVADDKAPLAAFACAFMEADDTPCRIVYVGVVEEETTSRGSLRLVEEILQGQIPRPDAIIIGEPTGIDRIVYAYRGSTKLLIRSRARGGHASTPIASSNPILKVYELYKMLCEVLGAGNRFDTITLVPTVIHCGDAPNKIPESCEMIIDVRIPPGRTCNDVLQVGKMELRDETSRTWVETGECIEPVVVHIANKAARAVTRAIVDTLKRSPLPARKWGTSDMNIMVNVTRDIIAYGPGQHETTHTETECVYFSEFNIAIDIIKRAFIHFAKLCSS